MLKRIKQEFQNQLSHLYDSTEIDELFFLSVEEVLGLRKSQMLLNKSMILSKNESKRFQEILSALCTGRPIQYILGFAWFYGMRLKVNEHVLIPRPETEELVNLIIQTNTLPYPRILDIGTGSGCIPIGLKKNIPAANVQAWDISAEALRVAQENADKNQTEISFSQVDILSDIHLGDTLFDIIVSNPPYVTSMEKKEMHDHVLRFEPTIALFVPDEQPLLFYEVIARFAKKQLTQGGLVFFEINRNYASEINSLLEEQGFHSILIHQDMQGHDRMISACRT